MYKDRLLFSFYEQFFISDQVLLADFQNFQSFAHEIFCFLVWFAIVLFAFVPKSSTVFISMSRFLFVQMEIGLDVQNFFTNSKASLALSILVITSYICVCSFKFVDNATEIRWTKLLNMKHQYRVTIKVSFVFKCSCSSLSGHNDQSFLMLVVERKPSENMLQRDMSWHPLANDSHLWMTVRNFVSLVWNIWNSNLRIIVICKRRRSLSSFEWPPFAGFTIHVFFSNLMSVIRELLKYRSYNFDLLGVCVQKK